MPLNNEVAISVKRLHGKDISLPRYMTENSAGMDIFAAVDNEETLLPGERRLIPTGIAIAPDGGHVYIASKIADTVTVFSRDTASGRLTFVEAMTGP